MRFRARELREGIPPDELRRELNAIQKELRADLEALSGGSPVTSLQIADYSARYGDVVRVAPPTTGLRVILPPVNLAQPNGFVVVVVEGSAGALTVEAVDTTVNGSTTLAFLAGVGTVEFRLTPTGWYGWSASLQTIPLTSLAAQAADTFNGNFTAVSAPPTARAGSSVAGAGLTYTTGGTLAVGSSTSITVNADDIQRAALTGDVTAAANVNATTIAANAVTNAKLAQMAARRVKLRADSAGNGDPIDGTGLQLGEILRLATLQSDATSTGTIVTYTVAEATNVIRFTSGITALTLRGATIPAETGQVIVWENNDDTGVNVTFNNEDGSAAAAGNRFRCPGGVAYVLVTGHRLVTCYINTRHRIIATA